MFRPVVVILVLYGLDVTVAVSKNGRKPVLGLIGGAVVVLIIVILVLYGLDVTVVVSKKGRILIGGATEG